MTSRWSGVLLSGFALGLAGSVLDFYSGYQVLGSSSAWGTGILALGVLLLVTALVSVSSVGMNRMKIFGGLMALYGIVMLFLGASMYSGVTPMMQGNSILGAGMLAFGGLMLLNGPMMYRSQMTMGSPKMGHAARNVSLVVAGAIILSGVALAANPSFFLARTSGGMETTGGTTTSTESMSAQVTAGAANCSGSGTSEQCRMNLTNSGLAGATITGGGTLSYSGAGGMGINSVVTQSGCRILSGSLSPGMSAQVDCVYSVNEAATSGSQLSGSVGLGDGTSVPFLGTAA